MRRISEQLLHIVHVLILKLLFTVNYETIRKDGEMFDFVFGHESSTMSTPGQLVKMCIIHDNLSPRIPPEAVLVS